MESFDFSTSPPLAEARASPPPPSPPPYAKVLPKKERKEAVSHSEEVKESSQNVGAESPEIQIRSKVERFEEGRISGDPSEEEESRLLATAEETRSVGKMDEVQNGRSFGASSPNAIEIHSKVEERRDSSGAASPSSTNKITHNFSTKVVNEEVRLGDEMTQQDCFITADTDMQDLRGAADDILSEMLQQPEEQNESERPTDGNKTDIVVVSRGGGNELSSSSSSSQENVSEAEMMELLVKCETESNHEKSEPDIGKAIQSPVDFVVQGSIRAAATDDSEVSSRISSPASSSSSSKANNAREMLAEVENSLENINKQFDQVFQENFEEEERKSGPTTTTRSKTDD